MSLRRFLVVVGVMSIALGLGAAEQGAADIEDGCAGKPLCATVTDLEWASVSPSETDRRYMANESVTVFNGGTTSKLVNVTVVIAWWDEGVTTTTSSLVTASSFTDAGSLSCTESTPGNDTSEFPAHRKTMTCGIFKSLEPLETLTYAPLIFGTATNDAATGTTVAVKATAKEQDKPSKGGAPPNDAVVRVMNTTPYEPRAEEDLSIAGAGLSTTLATKLAEGKRQISLLPVPASAERGLYELKESSCPAGASPCLPGSLQVTTVTPAPGLSPVNLQIIYEGRVPGGTTEGSIVVYHKRSNGTEVLIDISCSGGLWSGQPPQSEWDPNGCRRVKLTRLAGGNARIEIDAWDLMNGDWRFG